MHHSSELLWSMARKWVGQKTPTDEEKEKREILKRREISKYGRKVPETRSPCEDQRDIKFLFLWCQESSASIFFLLSTISKAPSIRIGRKCKSLLFFLNESWTKKSCVGREVFNRREISLRRDSDGFKRLFSRRYSLMTPFLYETSFAYRWLTSTLMSR